MGFDENQGAMIRMLRDVLGPLAADFISRACNPNTGDRWSARELLDHPYIRERVVRVPIKEPQRIIIRGVPNPYVHRRFEQQRNLEREIVTAELLRRIGFANLASDDSTYTGAMNVCAAYLNNMFMPLTYDEGGICSVLDRPETFSFLSKHLFVDWSSNYH